MEFIKKGPDIILAIVKFYIFLSWSVEKNCVIIFGGKVIISNEKII